ncbi:hypothetical protein OHU45_21425 [Streptomyces tubercidicus]|uniref:hypothetical protein n=1 Tax=Streptomyces tubercidicus TaxID=47759 RepID=UPI0030E43CC4
MVRNVLGCLIALAGAAAAVWSPFRPWYDGRHGNDVRIEDLFNGLTRNSAPLFGSLLLPMAFAALLTLIGVALRSRGVVAFAGLVVLGFTILWMVRQGQAASELTAGARGLGVGVANALGGGALLLLGALIMRGRPRRVDHYDDRQYDDGRYGRYAYDDRYDDRYDGRTPYDPYTPYPPGTPEPWDAGRPGAEEWNPEPYPTGPGQQEDTPTTPLPITPPPPPPQGQRPQAQQQPQHPPPHQPQQQPPPPPPPPPARPGHRQPPTPPVEWGRDRYQPRPAQPEPPKPDPEPTEQRDQPDDRRERPPEERE